MSRDDATLAVREHDRVREASGRAVDQPVGIDADSGRETVSSDAFLPFGFGFGHALERNVSLVGRQPGGVSAFMPNFFVRGIGPYCCPWPKPAKTFCRGERKEEACKGR